MSPEKPSKMTLTWLLQPNDWQTQPFSKKSFSGTFLCADEYPWNSLRQLTLKTLQRAPWKQRLLKPLRLALSQSFPCNANLTLLQREDEQSPLAAGALGLCQVALDTELFCPVCASLEVRQWRAIPVKCCVSKQLNASTMHYVICNWFLSPQ